MYTKKEFWDNTNVLSPLNIFTGKMSEYLKSASPAVIENVAKHIHHIFRRWYFLSISDREEQSAADMLEYYQKTEKWPKGGQFFVLAQLIKKDSAVDVELDVDYISFSEQPLLVDIRNQLNGIKQELFFPHDEVYKELISKMAKIMVDLGIKNIPDKEFDLHDLQAVWSATITSLCSIWMEADPFIGGRFTLSEFIKLWEGFLQDALKQDVNIDDVMDAIVFLVREKYPNWAYTLSELEEKEQFYLKHPNEVGKMDEFEKMQGSTFYHLGLSLDKYFLTPLSTYLLFITTHYTNHSCFEEDMGEAFKSPKADIHYLFSDPCSAFHSTGFGVIVAKGVIEK